jgi:hypothetical protein
MWLVKRTNRGKNIRTQPYKTECRQSEKKNGYGEKNLGSEGGCVNTVSVTSVELSESQWDRLQWNIYKVGRTEDTKEQEAMFLFLYAPIVQRSFRIMGLYLVFLLVGFLIGVHTVRTAWPRGIPSIVSAIIGGDYSASTGNTVMQKLHYWLQWEICAKMWFMLRNLKWVFGPVRGACRLVVRGQFVALLILALVILPFVK